MTIALDTSVAIALLVKTHDAHLSVAQWWSGREVALAGHTLAETYSVLTRLPGDARLDPADAATLLRKRFAPPLLLGRKVSRDLPAFLARHEIAGGATYDALVALAALEHGVELATRDARARDTYERLGVKVAVVG